MFKHLLTPVAAASLLCVGCSQLNPFSGDSDNEPVATASWNQSSETDSSWNQEQSSDPIAANTQGDGHQANPGFEQTPEQASNGGVYGFATAEDASASPYTFGGANSDEPATEMFARVEALQATTTALSADLKQLNKQFNTFATTFNANAAHAQTTDRLIENATGQIGAFGDAMASLDSQISSIAAEVSATRSELRDVKTDVRNVSNSTTANLTPVIENGSSSTGNWFKVTLAALVVGFAALCGFCWKSFRGNRGDLTAGR